VAYEPFISKQASLKTSLFVGTPSVSWCGPGFRLPREGRAASSLSPNPESKIISLTFGEPKLTPVRDLISRSRTRPTGKYPCWKMGRMMQWESIAELKAFRLLDCDAKIRRFVEQPCEIVYIIGSETRRHYPDIYVEYQHEKQLWEVKDDSCASEADLVARTKLLTEGLKAHGFTYRLVLASELRKQPRLQNANILLSYGRGSIAEIDRERVRLKLQRAGSLSWGGACAGEYGPNGRQILCRLTLEGVLMTDMDQPLSANSLFRVAEGAR
jgi:hypothetical protein